MSTLRVNTLQNAAGTGQPAMSGAAKAWVNFNGTGTVAIRAAFNVTSITDVTTGTYNVNFTTALEDANYAVNGSCGRDTNNGYEFLTIQGTSNMTTSSVRVSTRLINQNLLDQAVVCVSIFR